MRSMLLLVVAVLVVGCFKEQEERVELSGFVAKGRIEGAEIAFFGMEKDGRKGKQLGVTTTDTHGWYTTTMSKWSSPILAETSGGTYTDEATGSSVKLAAADRLTAVLPVGVSYAAISPLTHMAAVRARSLAKDNAPLATAVDSSNFGVAAQYSIDTIIESYIPDIDWADSVSMSVRDERIHALVLAGFSQQANQLGVRAIDLAYALADDVKDGKLDGKSSGAEISVPTIAGGSIVLSSTAGTTDLQAAIDAFIASAKNTTNIAEVKLPLTPIQIGINTTFNGWLYSTTTVMPARLSGKDYSYTLTAKGGQEPYSCALKEGSSLPPGFSLAPSPNSCEIIGEVTTVSGDTISPPFTITLADSSSPPSTVDIGPLRITTLREGPTIIPLSGTCILREPCTVPAPKVVQGVPPYSFRLASGNQPPLGMTVNLDGTVTGTPVQECIMCFFGICAVDIGGRYSCASAVIGVSKKSSGTPSGCQSYTKDDCCPVMSGISVVSCAIDKTFFNDCLKGVCPAGTTLDTSVSSSTVATCTCP